MSVLGFVTVEIIEDPDEIARAASPLGKPFMRLTLQDGQTLDVTLNLMEMLGGAAAGTRERWEAMQRPAAGQA